MIAINFFYSLLNKIVKTKFFLIISKFEFKKIYKENTDEIAKLLANFVSAKICEFCLVWKKPLF
jgi:hypothetical protein